jgi:transposase-like protein
LGLSRRQFTKEFQLAAVRRLEQGVPMADVAPGMEVSPNVLHRWGKEFREGPGNAFSGNGNPRWAEGRVVELKRKLTAKRMVKLAGVSRASFYRFDEGAGAGPDPDMDLRDAMQRIALEWPSDGRPGITAELLRRGWTVNPKKVYRLNPGRQSVVFPETEVRRPPARGHGSPYPGQS